MPVPKPDPMPIAYRNAYWSNWANKWLWKKSYNRNLTGRCAACGTPGILGVDLIHRGMPLYSVNLLCGNCAKDGADGDTKTPPRRGRLG